MKLIRKEFRADGIFGELRADDDTLVAVTLEHAYDSGHGDGSFLPKVSPGEYTCVRGQHQLHGMAAPFTTFEITGVVGHSNILFHMGNFNKDSEGCVLLGEEIAETGNSEMITNSRATFAKFISGLDGIDSFTLTVS